MEDYHIFQGENKVACALPKTMGAHVGLNPN